MPFFVQIRQFYMLAPFLHITEQTTEQSKKIFIYISNITIKKLGAPMAIDHNLLTGQFSPLGENRIENTLSASQRVLPTHTGKKALRHFTPRNRKPKLEKS